MNNNPYRNFQPRPGVVDNNLASNRLLVLKVMDGMKPKSSSGLVDPRLFTGENNLHLVMNRENSLWTFKYDHGNIPGALNQSFTSPEKALDHARAYLRERNLEITEVKDLNEDSYD